MFNSPPVISRLLTEDKKELYTTSNMQQNTILMTISKELYKIHSKDAPHIMWMDRVSQKYR